VGSTLYADRGPPVSACSTLAPRGESAQRLTHVPGLIASACWTRPRLHRTTFTGRNPPVRPAIVAIRRIALPGGPTRRECSEGRDVPRTAL